MLRKIRVSRCFGLVSLLVLLLGGAAPALAASSPNYVRWKLDPTPAPGYLGFDAAISGNTVVVGASGAAHVFVRVPGGWRQQARLVAPDRLRRRSFGDVVAIDRDTLAVAAAGASEGGNPAGAVYVFVREPGTGAWSLQAMLEAPEPSRILFGAPIAISGDLLAVGGFAFIEGEGRIFLWRRQGTTWNLEETLVDNRFESFALAGNTLAVGEPSTPPNSTGAVRVFIHGGEGWREQAVLQSPDQDGQPLGAQASFGQAVALDGNTLLASAVAGLPPYRAYVFVRRGETWRHQATLTDPQGNYHGFGWSVALDGNRALIGAFGGRSGPTSFGIGYVYLRAPGGQWQLEDQLIAPGVRASNNFGPVVDLAGNRAVIVSGPQGGSVLTPGSAYVFERRLAPAGEGDR
jgi:FG-GAP repeat